MSTSATGSVVDKESGNAIKGLTARLEDTTQVHELVLATGTTNGSGAFSLTYSAYPAVNNSAPGNQPRGLRLSIQLGQLVLYQLDQPDNPDQDAIVFDKIVLPRGEAESHLATLGSGTASRMTTGNALRWLADNVDAWSQTARVIKGAATLDVMQLEIDVNAFNSDGPLTETPRIVLDFTTPDDPSANLSQTDDRVERVLLDAAWKRDVDVRIQLPTMSIDKNLGAILVGIGAVILITATVLFLLLIVLWAFVVLFVSFAILFASLGAPSYFKSFYRKKLKEIAIEQWFQDAQASNESPKQVAVHELVHRSLNITHAKMVIDRGNEAILLGSPFEQVYYDSPQHLIDEPRRGTSESAGKGPIHDVSVGLRGPAVGKLQEIFDSHWNIADPGDLLPVAPLPALPAVTTALPEEFLTTVQIAFTLDRMFTASPQDGEKGIQEAYLRAIYFAERFIYIENQYFHNPRVVQALIDALAAKPKLVVILLLNVSPDMPYYLRWQRSAIQRIRDSLASTTDPDAAGKRLGVFSSWSYADAAVGKTKPRLAENYLHTKTAIIDNVWATVGSANLDGASQDSEDYFRSVIDGDVRHTEANVVVYEDSTVQTSAVDALRRRLWSEHLGFVQTGNINPGDPLLTDKPDDANSPGTGTNWLEVWKTKAAARLVALGGTSPDAKAIHILEWPSATSKQWPWQALLKAFSNHYANKDYLDHLFSQGGNPNHLDTSNFDLTGTVDVPFKYGG
jgi:phosphatidylserine/phosphatidylglycerophosphate/cardiolipin synthase-like enzyme